MTLDIKSGRGYPASALSNFAPHPFIFRGIKVASMEGFLQGLKFKNPEMQKYIFTLVGVKAKYAGKKKKWWKTQTLWFQGEPIERTSKEYQELLDEAYNELAKNESFKKALLATQKAVLTHNIGRRKQQETVLTRSEFCSRLTKIREKLQDEENNDDLEKLFSFGIDI